jgi:glycosyltransferase involved in cell wall biosynthesis
MRSILLVSYAFPPSAQSGIHRICRLAKSLPHFGWRPVVLTVAARHHLLEDRDLVRSLPADLPVYRARSIEFSVVNRMTSDKAVGEGARDQKQSRLRPVLRWLRSAFMVPDDKVGWTPFAVSMGRRLLKEERIDAIYSTSPYASSHLVALGIRAGRSIPWIADLRDPWTRNPFALRRPFLSRAIDRAMEALVFRQASRVTVTTDAQRAVHLEAHPRLGTSKVVTLLNGFDPDEFPPLPAGREPGGKFVIAHVGNFYGYRVPDPFLDALALLLDSQPTLRNRLLVRFVGSAEGNLAATVRSRGLDDVVSVEGFVGHRESLQVMQEADLLLLVIGDGPGNGLFIPAKLFEYLGAARPILALSPPEGAAARLLAPLEWAAIVTGSDREQLAGVIARHVSAWERGEMVRIAPQSIQPFTSERMAAEVVRLLEDSSSSIPDRSPGQSDWARGTEAGES